MKKILILILSAILMAGLLTSCKKKKGDPPVLPDEESMIIDFSNFEIGKSADFLALEKGVENSNWEFAATVAGYWKAILTGTLIVPVSAFKLAVDQSPEWIEENTWEWNYSASVLSVTYNARLVGQIRASDVKWTMYISRTGTGEYPEFVWFEGTSDLSGNSGQWILNHSYTYQESLLQIDWTKTGDSMGTVKYEYVRSLNDNRETDTFNGSYIEYGVTSSTLDGYYSIHYYSSTYQTFWDVDVEWSTVNYNGRVMCSPWFGDSDWHCWNSQLVNITCE
jgi:hypothetical protein